MAMMKRSMLRHKNLAKAKQIIISGLERDIQRNGIKVGVTLCNRDLEFGDRVEMIERHSMWKAGQIVGRVDPFMKSVSVKWDNDPRPVDIYSNRLRKI